MIETGCFLGYCARAELGEESIRTTALERDQARRNEELLWLLERDRKKTLFIL